MSNIVGQLLGSKSTRRAMEAQADACEVSTEQLEYRSLIYLAAPEERLRNAATLNVLLNWCSFSARFPGEILI